MIETNLTKEDIKNLRENPYFEMLRYFVGKDQFKKMLDEVEKEMEKENKEPEKPVETKKVYAKPSVKVTPLTVPRNVKVDKDSFYRFLDKFAEANDIVENLENNGLMFTENSPIIMYENLISGLLESIFGKTITEDIIAYVYGNGDYPPEYIWNQILENK